MLRKAALKRALRWGQYALAAAAVLMLGYCCVAMADGWLFQQKERRQLEELLHNRQAASDQASRLSSPSTIPASASAGGLIGRIEIPRLGLSVMIAEGVDALTLRRAAGHIPGTGMPGEPGNIGIAGHRDTFFRPLRNIRPNDIVTLTTAAGRYRYRVLSTRVVKPGDVGVLEPSGGEILTLVTCYPFYFVGPAPSRFIVRAARVV
jgi:sortase A